MTPRICLAPLRGVTDAVFRNVYAQLFTGVDWAVAPFLTTTTGQRIKPSILKDVLPENNRRLPLTPQILSKSAARFIVLAEALFDLGYQTVNWNLGCPYPMVAKKGRGSGLLHQPDTIRRILDRIIPAISGRLSIKMRLGRFQGSECHTLIPLLNDYDLEEIIVHPRTGVQMYQGQPDLDMFQWCLVHCDHRLIYNGDIVDRQSFVQLQRQFPSVKAWMIGRGAIVNPFLPGMIKGQGWDSDAAIARFQQYHDLLYAAYGRKLYGPAHLINRMKGLWGYFAKAFVNGHKLRKRINKTTKIERYEEIVSRFFNNAPQWNPELFDTGKERPANVATGKDEPY